MSIFIAGGSGTIGIPLVRALAAAGHEVTAMTRTKSKEGDLRALGASVAIADALNRDSVIRAVAAARATHVIHQLTALPKAGAARSSDLDATNRLRVDGTRHLLDAAIAAGARRFVAGSFAMLAPRGEAPAAPGNAAADAIRSMETQVLDANAKRAIEGVILRYGLFYGADVPSTVSMIESVRRRRLPIVRGDAGALPVIHIDDAVAATMAALDRGHAGAVYDIVDDRPVSLSEIVATIAEYTGASAPWRVPAWVPRLVAPYMARLLSMRLSLSNAKAKADLGWRPKYPTLREGLRGLTK